MHPAMQFRKYFTKQTIQSFAHEIVLGNESFHRNDCEVEILGNQW